VIRGIPLLGFVAPAASAYNPLVAVRTTPGEPLARFGLGAGLACYETFAKKKRRANAGDPRLKGITIPRKTRRRKIRVRFSIHSPVVLQR